MNDKKEDTPTTTIKVAHVISELRVVINKGSNAGIKMNQRFLLYTIGEDIVDPDTGQSLGKLELVKGTGRVTHVQPLQATIESDMERNVRTSRRFPGTFGLFSKGMGGEEVIYGTDKIPFEYPETGDLVKPV